MKKFFSLVLALVMALSLTTVAWGTAYPSCTSCADATHIAAVGTTHYDDLQEAIVAAAPAGTVEILKDVTVAEWKMFAETMTHADIITCNINGLTINGNGHKLTVNSIMSGGNGGYLFYAAEKLNINNLTITYGTGVNGGISLKAGTLDTVTFAGGNGVLPGAGDVTIKNCVFNTTGQAIYYEEARPNLEITDNEFNVADNANVIILRGGETFTENEVNSGRTVNIKDDTTTVSGNTFNTRVKLYEEGQELSGNSFDTNGHIELDTGVTNADVSGNYWGGGAPTAAQLGGATATTYYTTDTGAGLSGMTSNVPATDNLTRYTLWGAKVAATATGVNYIATDMQLPTATKAVAPTATNLAGAVAYYTVGGSKYIKGTANDCDIYFTVKGKTTPVMYLKEIGTQNYWAVATEFTNFGKKCGQSDTVVTENTKYYTYTALDGTVYVHAEDTSVGAMANAVDFLLVGGKMVPVVPTNVYNEVAHTWTFAYDEAGKVVSAKCEDCGVTAKVYTTYTAVPAGAKYIREGAYFLVVNAPVVTDKVQSAETFDAGIAMYVGMSVMAAAGSAVVIGKKKD